jgi:hypothetical protein
MLLPARHHTLEYAVFTLIPDSLPIRPDKAAIMF